VAAGPGHDCQLSGCQPHTCKPMKANTIRQIHSILSGAFAAAQRWEWVDGNPADSARPPTARPAKQPATPPADVAKVIAEGRRRNQPALAQRVSGTRTHCVRVPEAARQHSFLPTVDRGPSLRIFPAQRVSSLQ
jgi:hypothetical protein